MIKSAEEFFRLRMSEEEREYDQAYRDEASEGVWRDVLNRYPNMHYWVAVNKTVPMTILRILADSSDSRVREAVATRRKIDWNLFDKLASDPDENVRIEIVYSKKAPREILDKLCHDPVDWVAEAAREARSRRFGSLGIGTCESIEDR